MKSNLQSFKCPLQHLWMPNMTHFKFKINMMCLYKSTKPRLSFFPVGSPDETSTGRGKKAFKVLAFKEVVHMSALILSKEL